MELPIVETSGGLGRVSAPKGVWDHNVGRFLLDALHSLPLVSKLTVN